MTEGVDPDRFAGPGPARTGDDMPICKVPHFMALKDGSEVFVAHGDEVEDATNAELFDIPERPAPRPGKRAASA